VESWRISVDGSRCIGSGLCAATAPEYFRLEGKVAKPVVEQAAPDEAIRDAADCCPAEAIEVRDAVTAALVAPEQ
jgi:ferredoxin